MDLEMAGGFEMAGLADIVRIHAARRPDAAAIVYEGRTTTYAGLDRVANRVANGLVAANIKPQMRVAHLDKSSDLFFELLFGAAKANAVMVSVNWRLAPPEVLHIVNDAEAEILFVGEEYFPVIEKICDELTTVRKIVALGGRHPSWESFEAWRDRQAPDDPRLAARPEDTAIQFYTSGTTGLPKRAAEGRCEGRKPAPVEVVAEARRLARKSPKTGQRRSLRAIASELASLGHVGPRVVRIMRAVCAICSPVDAGLLAIWAIELCANVSKDNPHELIPLLASTG